MLESRLVIVHFIFAVILMPWSAGTPLLVDAEPESFDSIAEAMQSHSASSEEKSSTDLETKLLFLDELVSLENDVIETKKKRSFPGFGSPLDRLSAGSVDMKGKQRKVVQLPKRRFGVPVDRIGTNRLANTRG
ncbi:osteocrin [Tachyglossus aculeatus]|uniref:osteocrin n=1 Tax=Tachyglossus aculeatus TaxID=9261 RepID=UPI0018F5AFA4|nr:osteocrin [Tachyglossus aculeatus]